MDEKRIDEPIKKYVELFQRYVGGEIALNALHKKLYQLGKRVDLEEEDALAVGIIEDLESEVDALSRRMTNQHAHDDGELRYQIAAMLIELHATIGDSD